MRGRILLILVLNVVCLRAAIAQDNPSTVDKVLSFPTRFTDHINKKTDKLEEQLLKQTEKYLQRLAKKEDRKSVV